MGRNVGLPSANPYELYTKRIKKEHREITKDLVEKGPMLKGRWCKVALDSMPLASFGSNLI